MSELVLEGSEDFIKLVENHLQIGDRRIRLNNKFNLGGLDYSTVYVNFINLPKGIGEGGAEAENNRTSFWIRGFDKKDPHASPPTGKVKIEMSNTTLPESIKMRGKTGTPGRIALYLAEFLNKVVKEVEPNFTHTKV